MATCILHDYPVKRFFKRVGVIFGIIGALLIATNCGYNLLGYGFFTAGAIACLHVSFIDRDQEYITLWGIYFTINLIGLINYAS